MLAGVPPCCTTEELPPESVRFVGATLAVKYEHRYDDIGFRCVRSEP